MKRTDADVSVLWDALDAARKDVNASKEDLQKAKNAIAAEYYHLVEEVAKRLATRLKEVTSEECASYGVDGLYEAIEKFDRAAGNQFKTFAPHRIRGAILDNIRKVDWVPRLVRQRNSVVEKYRQSYFKEHGYYPSDEEMSGTIEFVNDKYDSLLKNSYPISVMSMHNKPNKEQDGDFDDLINVANSQDVPIRSVLREEMFKKLLGKDFTRMERRIVYLVYYEALTMKEVSKQCKFSESRISQMHGDILRRLKGKIARNPEYASELEKLLQSNS